MISVAFSSARKAPWEIVTKAAVRLMQTRESVRTLLAIFDEMDDATQTVVDITAAGIIPAALEMMDRTTIEAIEPGAPVGFPRDAEAVLIVEIEGLTEHTDRSASPGTRHLPAQRRPRG